MINNYIIIKSITFITNLRNNINKYIKRTYFNILSYLFISEVIWFFGKF